MFRRFQLALPLVALAACAPEPVPEAMYFDGDTDETDTDDLDDDTVVDTEETRDRTDETTETDPSTDPSTTPDPGTTDPGTTEPTDGCPAGVVCIEAFPYTGSSTTTGAPSTLDGYSCAADIDESGPEVVYQVVLDQPGYLATEVWGMSGDTDVDVHILESMSAGDCVDRGHWTAGSLMMPGTYYVVVDSWVDNTGDAKDGAFSLDVNVTTPDDYASYGLDRDVFERALFAFDEAWFDGETDTFVYGVIDFSMPSDLRRFFVMDLVRGEMLFDEFVAHGEGSGDPTDVRYASSFSNIHESHQSSLGMVRVAETYYGSYGYSVRLDGLDPIYNDQVRGRAIVIHPAEYSTQDFVDTYGYTGRSWGCPAVDPAISGDLIDTIADGALILKYSDAQNFLFDGRFMPGF